MKDYKPDVGSTIMIIMHLNTKFAFSRLRIRKVVDSSKWTLTNISNTGNEARLRKSSICEIKTRKVDEWWRNTMMVHFNMKFAFATLRIRKVVCSPHSLHKLHLQSHSAPFIAKWFHFLDQNRQSWSMMKKHDTNSRKHEISILYARDTKSCLLIRFTSQNAFAKSFSPSHRQPISFLRSKPPKSSNDEQTSYEFTWTRNLDSLC
jgi:hypothetical protein